MAYERLLRTLFVLLEDFDSDGLQLLVSMVPPPEGVDEEVVNEVFYRATNFVRIDASIFHKKLEIESVLFYTILSSSFLRFYSLVIAVISSTDQTQNCTDAYGASSTELPCPRPGSQSRPTTAIQESDGVISLEESVSTTEISINLNPVVQNDTNCAINNLAKSPQV